MNGGSRRQGQTVAAARSDGRRVPLCIFVSLVLAGCTTTIVPPATVAEPAKAAVLDHGRHSSLLLEVPDGTVVRYAYGEWEWYAEGRTGPGRAFGALFLPSEAALGRKRMPGPLSPAAAREQVGEGFEEILVFEVDGKLAASLARRLDALFEAGRGRLIRNPAFDLDFVPIPTAYWLGRNSNQVTAEWLEELGCRVEGASILSQWRINAR